MFNLDGIKDLKLCLTKKKVWRRDIMKRLWTVLVLLLLLLAGCSSSSNESGAMDGEALYKKSCLACHGADLTGASGPAVVNMKSKYSEEEVLNIINNGVRMMPGKLLSEEEAQIVTEWLMEK